MSGRMAPWTRWYAWHPVVLNDMRPEIRVWLCYVERAYVCTFGGCMWYYRIPQQ